MKVAFFYLIIFVFAAFYGCRTVEPVRPVYFSADSNLFSDTVFPVQSVAYSIGLGDWGSGLREVELKEGEEAVGWIQGPTIIRKGARNEALVYPKEHIYISGNYEVDDFDFTTLNGGEQRNRELQVLKVFGRLQNKNTIPASWAHRLPEYSLQTILNIEQQVKEAIPKRQAASQHLFDSLLHAFKVSRKFKVLTKNYVKNRFDFNLLWVYRLYKDTLQAHDLYDEKLRALVPAINVISKKDGFSDNMRRYVDELLLELFPDNRMVSMPDVTMFRSCFDSIQRTFNGIAKDYLLTRVMVRAIAKGIDIPPAYMKAYKQANHVRGHRKYIKYVGNERRQKLADTSVLANYLQKFGGNSILPMEDVMVQFKGKFVLIDCWASWCMPCLKEMPHLKELIEKYKGKKIEFVSLSIDKSSADWRREIHKRNLHFANNYLLVNALKAALTRQYDIETIPRYLLFDMNGDLINADVPWPSDPALQQLLDSLLAEKTSF